MFELNCHCCGHNNPGGSRFCNDCGSPLHLKSCPQCGAANDPAAVHCYQCQTAFGPEAPPLAARAGPAGDHSPRYGIPAASEAHSNTPQSLAKRPDPVAPNIQQSFDPDQQTAIVDVDGERGNTVPHVITMRGTTDIAGTFQVPPTARLHRANRGILLIFAIGLITATAYYVDRHLGLLTGGVVAHNDRTFGAMKGDEASTRIPSTGPAKTATHVGPLPESPPGAVAGVASPEEGASAMDEKAHLDGSTVVPAKDTAVDMSAGLGKGPLRPASRADGVGQSRTFPRERAADNRNDLSAAPEVSTVPVEPRQTTAQATMKRGGTDNIGVYKARGTRRTLEDKSIPTPPTSEQTRPPKKCSQHERILGLCE